ncbi:hypothetical protein COF67_22260 [Bacillus toyonensis]|nr:hypothetical protein COF67_22260 [Bacillus toyonensis]
MPTFIKSIKDNKKLYGKTAFCIKIYLKLMDVWCYPYAKDKIVFPDLIFLIDDFSYKKESL